MSQPCRVDRSPSQPAPRSQIIAWALWDCGSTAFNAIVVTFVFAVYITGTVGADLPGDTSAAGWLGRAMAAGGLTVAVLAPATGIWVEAPHRRRLVLAVLTGLTVALTAAMSLIRDDHRYLWPALVLLACAAATSELATVPYNAMLRQLSTPQTSGRISGFGWSMGYFGSVTLLLVVYLGFIAGDGERRGLLGLPAADGQNVRAAMLLTAAWILLFALPLLITVPSPPDDGHRKQVGFFGAYRKLAAEIAGEWRRDRNVVYFLIASAVFRDGLAGVFAFGAVLGVTVFEVSEADVLLFGVCASVIAAIGAILGGLLDDRVGSKPVIIGSLAAMIAAGVTLMNLSGALAFWICGLLLCMFVGPSQSSARTLMLRMATDGKESVAFGLYTTTGRAMSFLSPLMFFTFIDLFGTDRAGMAGLYLVLAVGLLAMLGVRTPARAY